MINEFDDEKERSRERFRQWYYSIHNVFPKGNGRPLLRDSNGQLLNGAGLYKGSDRSLNRIIRERLLDHAGVLSQHVIDSLDSLAGSDPARFIDSLVKIQKQVEGSEVKDTTATIDIRRTPAVLTAAYGDSPFDNSGGVEDESEDSAEPAPATSDQPDPSRHD